MLNDFAVFNLNAMSNTFEAFIAFISFFTPQGDMFEALALDRLFGQHMPWISSTKGMTGHECWMAGASEVVYSILMMQGGFVAPNINFENPDEHSEKLRLATHRIDTQVNTVLSNSFGFGGTNSALVIKK